jgi:hypothetical protein
LISGRQINNDAHRYGIAHEAELWKEFSAHFDEQGLLPLDVRAPTDGKPNDLGYFIGYRIAQAYYNKASDKTQAIRDIITARGGHVREVLAMSGYAPGDARVTPLKSNLVALGTAAVVAVYARATAVRARRGAFCHRGFAAPCGARATDSIAAGSLPHRLRETKKDTTVARRASVIAAATPKHAETKVAPRLPFCDSETC